MPEARRGTPRGRRAAVGMVLGLAAIGLLAPVLASERPLLARREGVLLCPALADLPLLGSLFDGPEVRSVDWEDPGPGTDVLLRAPVPYSYRGVRLGDALRPPGGGHLLGTDALGRDLLARLIHGTRPSLLVGFGAPVAALLLGGFLGSSAALRGGLLDLLIIRVADVAACFPPFILALALTAALGHPGIGPMVAGIGLSRWTSVARYVRGEILRFKGGDLWASARASGASSRRLVLRHLLPLLAPPLAVMGAFGVAQAIIMESGLSFLGLGVAPPTPSWGTLLAEARGTLDAAWWPVVFPSAALLLALGALCLAADLSGAPARDEVGGPP